MVSVFVSYSHAQKDWVHGRLIPVLRAGGAEVLCDACFGLGRSVIGEMDATQDKADKHILCLSDEYLASAYCCHEMERALAIDPDGRGNALPLRLNAVSVPDRLKKRLYADFTNDEVAEPWRKLLGACGKGLGVTAPRWLDARDEILSFLDRGQSVNLVVRIHGAAWSALLREVIERLGRSSSCVDLEDGATTTRPDFLNEILAGLGMSRRVRDDHDLADFSRIVRDEPNPVLVTLTHFERIQRFRDDIDLSSAFRSLIMTHRKLLLLVHSRDPFAALLPRGHELSHIDIKMVELT